ncbi:MAG: hypothetical protein RXQ69_02695 [Acidilobus sp.]
MQGSGVTLEAIQQAVSQLFGHIGPTGFTGVGYALVLTGLVLLLGIIVIGSAVLIARGIKAMGNMTPGRFVAAIIALAVAFIIVGALVP